MAELAGGALGQGRQEQADRTMVGARHAAGGEKYECFVYSGSGLESGRVRGVCGRRGEGDSAGEEAYVD